MPGSLADRATSTMLIGPDWAMNMEICDICNRNPGEAKDIIKRLKKRLGHKNPKVQLLALTLLETMVKNCGDIVHMHVAEKEILHEMVKLVRKKQPDIHVKEKVLALIATWQEMFGGPQARYPQYYAAYQELLGAGAVFSQRPERSAPVFTVQRPPFTSDPQSLQNPDYQQEAPESSVGSDLPTMRLTEIENARSAIDILAQMLSALEPGNKKGLTQEVLVDLVDQCRSYKQRVVHLVNTTSDEELLREGLALNDELERVLARHDAILSGTAVPAEKPKTLQALVDVDDSAATNGDNSAHTNQRSNASIAPPASIGASTSLAIIDPNIDLLSGEDFSKPTTASTLALVPVTDVVDSSASSGAGQNSLVLSDVFSQNGKEPASAIDSNSVHPASQTYPAAPQLQLQPQQATYYSNGSLLNSGAPQYEQAAYIQGTQLNQANPSWNGQSAHGLISQQQAPYNMNDQSGALPLPPWEAHPVQNHQLVGPQQFVGPQPVQNHQLVVPQHLQSGQLGGGMHPQPIQSSHLGGMHPGLIQNNRQMGTLSPPMQSNQVGGFYSQPVHGGQFVAIQQQPMQGVQLMSYGYGLQQEAQYYAQRPPYPYASPNQISQGMYALSLKDNNNYINMRSPYQMPTTSTSYSQQSNRPSKPEDKLFGDLVNLAKSKQSKPDGNKIGSL